MNPCFSGEKAPNRDSRHQDDCTVTTGKENSEIPCSATASLNTRFQYSNLLLFAKVSPSSLSRFLINSCFSSENSPRNFSCLSHHTNFVVTGNLNFFRSSGAALALNSSRASRNSRLYLSVSFHMWLFSLLNACLETVTIKAYFSSSNSPSHS